MAHQSRLSLLVSITKMFDFKGRASRKEFLRLLLFGVLCFIAFLAAVWPFALLQLLGALLILITCLLSVSCRRAQDQGKAGWTGMLWLILPVGVMPTVLLLSASYFELTLGEHVGVGDDGRGFGTALILAFFGLPATLVAFFLSVFKLSRPSQPGKNRYGPNPHEVSA